MKFNKYIPHIIVVFFFLNLAVAEDFPGGPSLSQEEMAKGFSEEKGITKSEKEKLDKDSLKIGGQYKYELLQYRLSGATFEEWTQNPQTVSLYFDSHLRNDTRVFLKGRMIYDPAVDESITAPFSNTTLKRNTSSIDELKFQFQLKHKIFVTAGAQKIKWGVGHFWNPTDFLNSEKRDFLQTEDLRAGLGLLKIHVPLGNHNLYLVENFEKTISNQSIGTALRGEMSFSKSELSLTRYSRKGISSLTGADLSIGVWDFDFIFEGAVSDDGNSNSAVSGVSYQYQYSDEDSLTINLEGIWDQQGATSKSEYSGILSQNKWRPFHIAKAYQLISVLFPKPGSLNQSQIQFYVIRNQMDESCYYRGSFLWTGLEDISFETSLGIREGTTGSEMRIGGLFSDLNLSATLAF
jgi:hypothetical protein